MTGVGNLGAFAPTLAGEHRTLPSLVDANPVDFGRPRRLTTATALAPIGDVANGSDRGSH